MSLFGKVKNTIGLLKSVDLDALAKLSEKVDLSQVMSAVGNLDDRQLKGLMKMLSSQAKKGERKLPPVDGDFYNMALKLTPEERELQMKMRNFMEEEVKPIANDFWNRAEFLYIHPHCIIQVNI